MEASATVTPPHVGKPLRLDRFPALRLAASRIADPTSARAFARPYREVGARLRQWESRGLVTRDRVPALYLYEYTVEGVTVRGLVGALDVARRAVGLAERAVLPHEAIYPSQADDIADRMAQMGLNPAPILLVQRGRPALRTALLAVRERVPEHQFVDRTGRAHRIWAIRDADMLETIADELAPTTALVADGHHRYAAYLRLHQRDPGAATARGLAMLVDQDDTPLSLGPIHRVLAGASHDDVLAAARLVGLEVEPQVAVSSTADGHSFLVVTDDRWSRVHVDAHESASAVEVVHDRVLPALSYGPTEIGYHHGVEDALRHAGQELGPALLLPPPTIDRVLHLAENDRLLPEKATSFQPKPPPGVFLRSLHDGSPGLT